MFLSESTTFKALIIILILLSDLLLLLFLYLYLKKIFLVIKKIFLSRNLKKDELLILKYLQESDQNIIKKLTKNNFLKDRIYQMSFSFKGDIKEKFQDLFQKLGFAAKDIKLLHSIFLPKSIPALNRLLALEIHVPKSNFEKILHHKNMVFRWLAMELIIRQEKKFAYSWLISFIHDPKNKNKGLLVHLLTIFAQNSSEEIPNLLAYSNDAFLNEILLDCLSRYPIPNTEDIILRTINFSPGTPIDPDLSRYVLINAIKAMIAIPSPKFLHFFAKAVHHPDNIVREFLARNLANYHNLDAINLLAELTTDFDYQVREDAIKALINKKPLSEEVLKSIRCIIDHPSYYILEDFESLKVQKS
ncbi:MAG: HEAT repeat domain-containing protein [Candidatus Margulisiibacteriota bacterium]|jgi:hypothetical protein